MPAGTSGCTYLFIFEEGTLRMAITNSLGKLFLLSESGTVVCFLTNVACAPWHPPHAGAGMLHTKSFQRQRRLEGALMWEV